MTILRKDHAAKGKGHNTKYTLLTSLAVGLGVAATWFLLLPSVVMVFIGSEFFISAAEMLQRGAMPTLLWGLILALIVGVISFVMPSGGRLVRALIGAVAVTAIIVTIAFPASVGELVGGVAVENLPTQSSSLELFGRLALFAGVFALALLKSKLFRDLSILLAVAGAALCLAVPFLSSSTEDVQSDDRPLQDFATLSGNDDIVVVLMDELRGGLVEEVLLDKPAYADAFDGFTFYTGASSASSRTAMSLPNILSGSYYPGGPAQEWMQSATAEQSFMRDAQIAGYEIRYLQTMGANCRTLPCVKATSFAQFDPEKKRDLDYMQIRALATLRVLPELVPVLHSAPADKDVAGVDEENAVAEPNLFNQSFKNWTSSLTLGGADPVLLFGHFTHTHLPVDLRADCSYAGELGIGREAVMGEVECGVSQLAAFNAKLKALGAYDNTTILYIADHGENTLYYHTRLHPDEFPFVPGEDEHYHPIFFIKPKGASGPIRYSRAPVAVADVRKTLCDIHKSCPPDVQGQPVLSIEEGSERTRRIMRFRYGTGLADASGAYPEGSYEFVDFSGDFTNLKWAMFQPPVYTIGEELLFTTDGNGKLHTFTGWSLPQASGTLLDARSGDDAILVLPLENSLPDDPSLSLQIDVTGYIGTQEVAVSVNNQPVGTAQIKPGDRDKRLVFALPDAVIANADKLEISLTPDNPIAPSSVRESNDRRLLSIVVSRLVIIPS